MNCEKCLENLSAYSDRALTSSEMEAIEKHLKTCPVCQQEYRQLEEVVTLVGKLDEVEIPEGFHETLMMRIMEEKKVVKFTPRRWMYWVSGAAALIIGMTWMLQPQDQIQTPTPVAMKQDQLRSIPMESTNDMTDEAPSMISEAMPMVAAQTEEWTVSTSDIPALVRWLDEKGYQVQETLQTDGTYLLIQEVVDKEGLFEGLKAFDIDPQVKVESEVQSVTIFIKK